jgi:glycosyltransferase involved in cell wall biosynthesis
MDVSVIIPTFNRWPMLAEAVVSVMAQRSVDFELIIVDDGSTDDTAARLPHWLEEIDARHPVRILQTTNRGPAEARNYGVAAARAPLISFLDSDDLWRPDKLQQQVEYMMKHPQCLALQTEEIWLRQGIRVNPGRRHRKHGGIFFLQSLRTCLVSPSATIMRASLFRKLGGFDQDLRAAEDYDLWLRLLLECPIALLPEPLVIRRAGHPGQLSATVVAIDRFRILSLLKLLRRNDLRRDRREAVCDALIEKCRIYGNGAARRGNRKEADWIASIAQMSNLVRRAVADGAVANAVDMMRARLRSQQLFYNCSAWDG